MRRFPRQAHESLLQKLEQYLRDQLSVKAGNRTLKVKNIQMPDLEKGAKNYEAQKKSRTQGVSYARPVRAELELREDGETIDESTIKVMDLPQVTEQGSYIVDGNEYSFPLQKRLMPGVYTEEKSDGTIKAWFNTTQGRGISKRENQARSFKVTLRPDRGDFVLEIGHTKINLLALLKGLGVEESRIKSVWGKEVFKKNKQSRGSGSPEKALKKLYEKLNNRQYDDVENENVRNLRRWIMEYWSDKPTLDAENVEMTMGAASEKISPELILRASQKVLNVYRGDEEEDNRESLIHNEVYDLSDFVEERLDQPEHAYKIPNVLKRNLKKYDKISRIVRKDLFQKPIESTFTQSSLARIPKQNNPMDVHSAYTEITSRGEGGIESEHAVTREQQSVDPSHLGFIDPMHTPEGSSLGTTLHLTMGVEKDGRDLKKPVMDVESGEEVKVTPKEFYKNPVAFSEYYDTDSQRLQPEDGKVKAIHEGDVERMDPDKIVYAMRRSTDMFDLNSAAVPFLSHNNGTRGMTAAKMTSQAKALKHREAPKVQAAIHEDTDTTVESIVGRNEVPTSPVDGVVQSIEEKQILVQDQEGETHKVELPKNYWQNENNYRDAEPLVEEGEEVEKDQPLADTNYTKDGELAIGTNLKTAYTPYKGYNHEDGVVVSEKGADKLTSMHAHQKTVHISDDEILDKDKYRAYFPSLYDQKQFDMLDENGVIQEGEEVKRGDPLVCKMRSVEEEALSKKLKNVSRMLAQDYRDTSVTWEKQTKGVVDEVHMRQDDIMIVVKTEERAQVGDKLVGRYGNKGVITKILDNEEAPKTEDDEPVELMINPDTVPGRMNLGQIMEVSASKIADHDDEPYIAKPFGKDHTEDILKDLEERGLEDHETIYDPVEDEEIDGVLVGDHYTFKLEHQVEKKMSSRGAGPDYPYSLSGQPAQGGEEGGRAIGMNVMYALLAHGADANLDEMYTFKGDKSHEHWRAVENGLPLPPPEMPESSKKFASMMRGMGVDLQDDEDEVKMTPFLDEDIEEISNGEVEEAKMLRAKDLKEEDGGLFDFETTGGLEGEKWSHIELAESMPHPVFEKSIKDVTGMTQNDFDAIMEGEKGAIGGDIVDAGKPGAKTGGEGIKEMLSSIDPEKRLDEIKEEAPGKSGTPLNKLHREARVLKNFQDEDKDLEEMVVSKIPVLPPKFRPVIELPDGDLHVSDVNEHYRSAILMNNQLEDFKDREGLEEDEIRSELYEGLSGTMGLSMGLVNQNNVKGLADTIAGDSPKRGYFQKRLLKRRQDVSGTGVVSPDPKLEMDEIGIPEEMAWDIFEPFIKKEMKRDGMSSFETEEEIEERSETAHNALERAMDERPVLANRAPTLHKFSIMGFEPKLTSGHDVKMPVEVLGGFSADFDGDTFGIHVPTEEEAVEEAYDMMPSNNVYRPGSKREDQNPELQKEFSLGLYKLTKDGSRTDQEYDRKSQALRDARTGEIEWTDQIHVRGIGPTTAGRIKANKPLPEKYQDYQKPLRRGRAHDILNELEKEDHKTYEEVIDTWKHMGREHAYKSGTSLLLSDLQSMSKEKDELYQQADRQVEQIKQSPSMGEEEQDEQIQEIYSQVDEHLADKSEEMDENQAGQTNNIVDMVESGYSKPGKTQMKQLVGTLGLMLDHRQEVMDEPIRGNYAEGLDSSEYWQHMYAQRKGMIDKTQSVAGPGALSKELNNMATQYKVTEKDCGTNQGRQREINECIIDRVLAEPAGGVSAGTLIDRDVLGRLKNSGRDRVKVRTVLDCESQKGVCAMCFGSDETGHLPQIGKNIGQTEMQAITERSVQLPMKSFHCLHRGSVVFVKTPEGDVLAPTHEELYHMVEETPSRAGSDWEEKYPEGWQVWDAGQWTDMRKIGRHIQNRPMVAMGSKSGQVFVCQDNHPMVVKTVDVSCPKCNSSYATVEGTQTDSSYAVRCQNCANRWEVGKEAWKKTKPYLKAAGEVSDQDIFEIDISPIGEGTGWSGDFPPYLLGMFLAEGSIRQRKEDPPEMGSNVRRGSTKSGGRNIVGACFYQGDVRDRILSELEKTEISYSCQDRTIRINNAKLARRLSGECGGLSDSKRLPGDFLTDATKGQMARVLCGLIDGDGTRVDRNSTKFSYYSVSHALIQQIHLICQVLGIKSKIQLTPVREMSNHQGYVIRIYPTQDDTDLFKYSEKSGEYTFTRSEDLPSNFNSGVRWNKPIYDENETWVYDLTTASGTFVSGGIWNHNTGGVASADAGMANAFEKAEKVLRMPSNLPNKATLAETSGYVQEIRDSGYGGKVVVINGQDHEIPSNRDLKVSQGDHVQKGDKLCEGMTQAQEMMELQGVEEVQDSMKNELQDTFEDAGVDLHDRTYEMPVKALTEKVRITDPGDADKWVPGDYAKLSEVKGWNRDNPEKDSIEYHSTLPGAQMEPYKGDDWARRMGKGRIKSTIQEGAGQGFTSGRDRSEDPPFADLALGPDTEMEDF